MNTLIDTLSVSKLPSARSHPLSTHSTLHLLRVTTQHVPDAGHCAECGFTLSAKAPLCPEAAEALRELAKRDVRRASSTTNLAKRSTLDLLQMAASHHRTDSGRCDRCGFSYAADIQDCPNLRLIRRALEARGMIPMSPPDKDTGTCTGKPEAWDLAGQDVAGWERAIDACHGCPLLDQCRKRTERARADGEHVANTITAGVAYDTDGRPIERRRFRAYLALSSASDYVRTPRSSEMVAA